MTGKQELIAEVRELHRRSGVIKDQLWQQYLTSQKKEAREFFSDFNKLYEEAGLYLDDVALYPDAPLSSADEEFRTIFARRFRQLLQHLNDAGLHVNAPEQPLVTK